AETFLHWQSRKESPRFVMTVFVKDSDAGFWHNAAKFFDQQRRIINKGDNPAAPDEIVIARRQFILHQIDSVNLHVRERACAACCFHGADEVLRTFQRNHFTGGPDNLSQIYGCVALTRSDVENAFTNGNSGSLPAIQSYRSPDTMLQAEPGSFL